MTAFRTRHSVSLCCLYYRTSLAPRLDEKKVPVSLLNMPRLNFMSLHSPPQRRPLQPQLRKPQLNTPQFRKPQLNQLNFANLNSINSTPQTSPQSTQLNSANLASTNLHLLTMSLDSTGNSRLLCLDTQLYVWTSLAYRHDNEKLRISELILSRLHDPNL